MEYTVCVGNIGTVHCGDSLVGAESVFADYVAASKADYGRAAGEDVALLCGGEMVREYVRARGAECPNCLSWSLQWTAGEMCPHCANPREVAGRHPSKVLQPLA